ncbi:MAG: hypothetical protein ORN56_08530 [Chitinophagales bacterium]|nr:hypothetical protein [Chitinophagales bacterium]
MIKAILEFILIFFFLRFIFNFVLPLFSMSQRNKDNQQSNHSTSKSNTTREYSSTQTNSNTSKQKEVKKKDFGDYIEFEEIKEK